MFYMTQEGNEDPKQYELWVILRQTDEGRSYGKLWWTAVSRMQ